MKVLGISASPRGNESITQRALNAALKEVNESGIQTEHINLYGYRFGGCVDCQGCRKTLRCSQDDDFTIKLLPLITDVSVKGIIFASPVYFGGVTAQMKMFFDRTLPLRRNGFLFSDHVAGAIAVGGARNGGQELTAIDIMKFALIHGMIVVPDDQPTSHFGGSVWSRGPEGVQEGSDDIQQSKNLGKKIARIVQKLN